MKSTFYALLFTALVSLSACSRYGYLTTSSTPTKRTVKEKPVAAAPQQVQKETTAITAETVIQEETSAPLPVSETVIAEQMPEPAFTISQESKPAIAAAKTPVQSQEKISPVKVQKIEKVVKKSEGKNALKTMGILGLLGFLIILVGLLILIFANVFLGILLCLLGLLFIIVGKL